MKLIGRITMCLQGFLDRVRGTLGNKILRGGLIIIRKVHEVVPMSGVAFMKKKVMVVIRL